MTITIDLDRRERLDRKPYRIAARQVAEGAASAPSPAFAFSPLREQTQATGNPDSRHGIQANKTCRATG
jgi:hypothetical protein